MSKIFRNQKSETEIRKKADDAKEDEKRAANNRTKKDQREPARALAPEFGEQQQGFRYGAQPVL